MTRVQRPADPPGRTVPPARPGAAPSWRIGPAGPADAAVLAAVDAATSTRPWTAAAFEAELSRDDRCYLVARVPPGVGGEVVGYAGLAMLAGEAHVMGLAVHPAARRRGIGTALLAALVAAAEARGAAGVTLEVRASNAAAGSLYRRAGFEVAGTRPGYYPDGEDALIMWWHPGAARSPGSRAPASGAPGSGAPGSRAPASGTTEVG